MRPRPRVLHMNFNKDDGSLDHASQDFYFFFSYARRDLDNYLRRFFEDLAQRVEQLAPCRPEHATFRDLINIDVGDVWDSSLADALQRSRVLVSVYSPLYFSRPYCGKEFRVFMERGSGAKRATGILPVLWRSAKWLRDRDLPPEPIRFVQWENEDLPLSYLERGMRRVTMNRRGTYNDCLQYFAQQIVQVAQENPAPPLAELPSLIAVRNAFETKSARGPGGPSTVVVSYLTRDGVSPEEWHPFQSSPDGARAIVEGLMTEGFSLEEVPADKNLLSAITAARAASKLALIVADPTALNADLEASELFQSLRTNTGTKVTIVVPFDAESGEVFPLRNRVRKLAGFDTSSRQVREVIGDHRSFLAILIGLLYEERRRVIEQRSSNLPEGERLPMIQGPGAA